MLVTLPTLIVLALAALAFGMLGYTSSRNMKPEMKWPLRIAVTLALTVALVDIATGFKLGMWSVIGPWLVGVGFGFLRRKQAEKSGDGSDNTKK